MKLSKMLMREKTNLGQKGTTTLNAPGVYKPPFGKGVFKVGGRGTSGNPSTPSTYAYTDAPVPGTAQYNPGPPGNVSGANPVTPGNFAGYNPEEKYGYAVKYDFPLAGNNSNENTSQWYGNTQPQDSNNSTPGYNYQIISYNYEGTTESNAKYNPSSPGNPTYNPAAPGNAIYNPTVPGTYTGTNPPQAGYVAYYNDDIPGNYAGTYPTYLSGDAYTEYYDTFWGGQSYSNTDHPWGPALHAPAPYHYNANPGSPGGSNVSFNVDDSTPGEAYYYADTPGNAVYNPTVPGNANYNSPVPGTANYNSPVPGVAHYNPYVSGNTGATTNVLGVTFPGGVADSVAPLISALPSNVSYSTPGTPVSVPTGGYITITAS